MRFTYSCEGRPVTPLEILARRAEHCLFIRPKKSEKLPKFPRSAVAAGCTESGPKPTPVEGNVALSGGKWPAPGTLYFSPIEGVEGFPRVPGTAEFDANGNFTARTFTPGDGLMPGKYRVHLACWKKVPTMQDPAGESHLPSKFRNPDHSGLQVTVEPNVDVCKVQLEVVP